MINANPVIPRSMLRGIGWPAVPDAPTSALLALSWQLEQSQWWSADELARHQHAQRALVLAHAVATTPHYAQLDPADWASVPVMSRAAIIAAGPGLLSRGYPAPHGPVEEVFTSRTSGEPVRVRSTGIVSTLWRAITLRDHLWHRRDLGARLATIRYVADGAPPPDGARGRGWGPATDALAPDAPVSMMSVASTTEQQIAWLRREDPAYLLVYPTVLDAILRRLAATGERLPALRQVRTISEALSPVTRALCREVLGAPVVDTYSAQEVGYIALQCPSHDHYHVQSERLFVEILSDDGVACRPGETGRVVVTDLHNFATPILRYDLGDYAEVGAACPCGRGLPVLTRIVGRRRGMVTYPDGRTAWPLFTIACREAARYRELQLVQPTVDALVVRVVPDGAFTDADRAGLIAALHRSLAHPFAITIEVVDELARSPAGKLEEFVSHV
jgi:phenylacetate-CoA ligase